MNLHFSAFVSLGKNLAKERTVLWDIPLDSAGTATKGKEWNLTEMVNDVPPTFYLRHFGFDKAALDHINAERASLEMPALPVRPLSPAWQDLIKSVVLEQIFFRRNSTAHAMANIVRPLKVIATCVDSKEPWQLNTSDVLFAVRVGTAIQRSGKLGDLIVGVIKNLLDANHLTDSGPLYPTFPKERIDSGRNRRSNFLKSESELRDGLEDRKKAERLPERKAFWELIRIVMTEKPRSFMDVLRFAGIRVMITTGMRIGEAVLLPADWKREREYYDEKGRPAGIHGGHSKSLMIRHFAEKQQIENSDSRILFEKTQHVPHLFEEILTEILDSVAELTEPLRRTLKRQTETGRILPWYQPDDLAPVVHIYPLLTGNPFWTAMDKDSRNSWMERYRQDFNVSILEDLRTFQEELYASGQARLDMSTYMQLNRMRDAMKRHSSSKDVFRFRRRDGSVIPFPERMKWNDVYISIAELETYIKVETPTKVSDTQPLRLSDRDLQPWELLFLHPKRSLSEERDGGICDLTQYIAVGRPGDTLIGSCFEKTEESIFGRYGGTEADRALTMNSHMLRHLQTTELFRLGVADTIISKRFNRRSVAQSYEYDHRSLAEELDQLEIPIEIEMALGEKATTVAKMIAAGKANGPIVDSYRRIQVAEGDNAGFEYLKVEVDGFHATPYGHCLNSFTVDPCPKHLECFTGCRHLSATDMPENRSHLVRLEGKLVEILKILETRPAKSIGRINQIEHAKQRLDGVHKLLAAKEGDRPFPNGPDLSAPLSRGIMDA